MILHKATPSIGTKSMRMSSGSFNHWRIEMTQGLNGLKQGIVFCMGSKWQRGRKCGAN